MSKNIELPESVVDICIDKFLPTQLKLCNGLVTCFYKRVGSVVDLSDTCSAVAS